MKLSSSRTLNIGVGLVAVILALIPFHAFLTVYLSSVTGHYTLWRLWKEILLVAIKLIFIYILWYDRKLLRKLAESTLVQCIFAYSLVQFIWGIIAYATHHVTLKAFGYGVLSNTRFLLFFLSAWVFATHRAWLKKQWPKLVFWPVAVVCVIGLLQYFVLPYDILKHFGYGENTIFPYETINHNLNYIRVMSTLRGANPLGAYLVLTLSLLFAWRANWRKAWYVLLALAGLLTLALSFSRSAWIGLVLSVATLLFISVHSSKYRRLIAPGLGVLIVLMVGVTLILRHNVTFENAFFHTQDHSKVATSSNEGHASALKSGVKDIMHHPVGSGTGTAGPASAYNAPRAPRIAENYFVQIGQETGLIGLALFLAINALLARELWRRRTDSLALGLLAALVGLSFVNLLSHAWSDDTLAYLFWGLAGIALAQPLTKPKREKS